MRSNGTLMIALLLCPPLVLLVLFVVGYAAIKKAISPSNDIYDEA